MKHSLIVMTCLLVAGLGLSAIPNTAQASCQSICVVAWRDCIRQAGGDPGLEAACDAELNQCILDCSGGGGIVQSRLPGNGEADAMAKTRLASCSDEDSTRKLVIN